jgi:hypothetical protein
MSLLFRKAALTFYLITVAACGKGAGAPVHSADLRQVSRIVNANSISFSQSNVDVQPFGDGAVTVSVSGTLMPDSELSTNSVWIPIVLLRELPEYISQPVVSDSVSGEVESYELRKGVWLVGVVLTDVFPNQTVIAPSAGDTTSPFTSSLSTPQALAVPPRSMVVTVKLTISSEEFRDRVPFAIPAGTTRRAVNVSATLPIHSALKHRNIYARQQNNGTHLEMALLPRSISGQTLRAATRFPAPTNGVWDFSDLAFNVEREGSNISLFAAISAGIAVLLLGIAAVLQLARKLTQIPARDASTHRPSPNPDQFESIHHRVAQISRNIKRATGTIEELRNFVKLNALEKELDSVGAHSPFPPELELMADRVAERIPSLMKRLENLNKQLQDRKWPRTRDALVDLEYDIATTRELFLSPRSPWSASPLAENPQGFYWSFAEAFRQFDKALYRVRDIWMIVGIAPPHYPEEKSYARS